MPNCIAKLLVNADIIIDLLYKREPFYLQCLELIKVSSEKKIKLFISAYSLSEIVKTLEKNLSPQIVKETVQNILSIFEIYGTTQTDVTNSAVSKITDFESAILLTAAKRLKANYIVSNCFFGLQTTEFVVDFITVPMLLNQLGSDS